jgi:enoyl-CoA hydratase
MSDSQDLVLVEHLTSVARLTINRPDKKNALNLALVRRLGRALEDLREDAAIRCVIITGSAGTFVAGADIAELRERRAAESLAGINSSLFRLIEEFPWPVIAAIEGFALGGGMELAMACDIRIAAETARFGQPELNLGILPAAGGMHRLPALVGMGVAKDLVLTGRIVDAPEALRIGLVSRVVPAESLAAESLSMAHSIADKAPLASKLAKSIMNALGRVRPDTAFALETSAQAVLFESDEKMRRMTEFIERKGRRI